MFERIKMKLRVRPWLKIRGDENLRLDYDLNENSVVFDLGGYEGEWSNDIFSKYGCYVHVFEPVREYSEAISKRFEGSKKIFVYNFGLSDRDKVEIISVDDNSSSIYKTSGSKFENIVLKNVVTFIEKNNLRAVDLIKINIEGGEYDLLEFLVNDPIIKNITNIQVQFHEFVPKARERMVNIQKKLAETHELTYHYPFVWENWKIKGNKKLWSLQN